MALQKSMVLDSGITLPNSYTVIKGISLIYGERVSISVATYQDRSSFIASKKPVFTSSYICSNHTEKIPQDGVMVTVWVYDYDEYFGLSVLNQLNHNVIHQGYAYLKTLDDYIDAIDIPD